MTIHCSWHLLLENGGGGSAVAAPLARQLLDSYLLPKPEPSEVDTKDTPMKQQALEKTIEKADNNV